MAGKFLSLEEAARHLGVTIDEINRLVDRKKLFPMRDGATLKFKLDEIERVAADMGEDASGDASGLSLDLDLSSPGLGGDAAGSGLDDLVIDDAVQESDSVFGDEGTSIPSQTIVQSKGGDASPVGHEPLVIGDEGSALAGSDLDFDSILSASSPSVAKGAAPPSGGAGSDVVGGSGTLSIDLGSAVHRGGQGSSPSARSGMVADSGLSLEGDDLLAGSGVKLGGGSGLDLGAGSGLDLGGTSGLDLGGGSGVDLVGGSGVALGSGPGLASGGSGVDEFGGSLGGDAFDLGGDTPDDDGASVVISTEETGDSSFFGNIGQESDSVSIENAAAGGFPSGLDADISLDGLRGPAFNVLQIVGLVCCTLFLLICAMVMTDLVWSIQSPAGTPVSSPLLKALTDLFSWR